MKKYRKKPIVIEAVQWLGVNQNEIMNFMNTHSKILNRKLRVKTMEGALWAKEGDYIIKGIKGEFYPCDNEIFLKTYEVI